MQKVLASILSSALISLLTLVALWVLPAASKTPPKNVDKQNRLTGEVLFRANGCFDCHSINGRGSADGVDLTGVGLRRNRIFLEEQLRDPEQHVKNNKEAFNSEPNLMTNPNLSRKEIDLIVAYLQSLKKPIQKPVPTPVRTKN
jgi:mono/diheme cytochrome c family protein